MNNTFRLRILAADKVFYEGNCTSLTIPTPGGELGILANHSNMIAAVVPGVLRGQFPDRPPQTAAVSGGVVKIEDNLYRVPPRCAGMLATVLSGP